MTAATEAPLICAGPRYPAHLVRPTGQRLLVKTLLTTGPNPTLHAWSGEVHTDGPVQVVHVPWWPAESWVPRGGGGTWRIATDQGLYVVEPGRGGCGRCSSLGRWQPFAPMRHASMPADLGSAL